MGKAENLSRFVTDFNNEITLMSETGTPADSIFPQFSKELEKAYTLLLNGNLHQKSLRKSDFKTFERLENQLIDHIIQKGIYTGYKDAYSRARYRCNRNAFLIHLLHIKRKTYETKELLVYSLRTAQKYQFYFPALGICHILGHDAAMKGQKTALRKYTSLSDELIAKIHANLKSDQLLYSILVMSHHKTSIPAPIEKQISIAYKEIKKLRRKYNHYNLRINYWRIAIRYFLMNHNPQQRIKIYHDYRKYMTKKPHLLDRSVTAEFAFYAMDAALDMRDLKIAKMLEKICHKNFDAYSRNWYVFMELLFITTVHSGDYEYAETIFMTVTKSSFFNKLDSNRIELWKLYEAYLHLLLPEKRERKKINPLKLINDLPLFSTDKKGLNFPILIAEFISILLGNYSDRLINFKPKFTIYVTRYVNRKTHERPWHFSKLILLLYKYDFDVEKCRRMGEKFYKKLCNFNKTKSQNLEMIEIVPYEHLWRHLTGFLQRRPIWEVPIRAKRNTRAMLLIK